REAAALIVERDLAREGARLHDGEAFEVWSREHGNARARSMRDDALAGARAHRRDRVRAAVDDDAARGGEQRILDRRRAACPGVRDARLAERCVDLADRAHEQRREARLAA